MADVQRGGRSRPEPGDHGKSLSPDDRGGSPATKEGAEADAEVARSRKRTTSRRELQRHAGFEQISPEVGELDEGALTDRLGDDPDTTLAMLADLTSATDPVLRALARSLAGRVFVDLARTGPASRRGVGRMVTKPWTDSGADVDLDASMETLAEGVGAVRAGDLRVRDWERPDLAVCLLVDRSGSMGGSPLAAAALAASAVAWRAAADYSVLAFAKEVVAVRSQGGDKPVETVVDDLLGLRGFGTTDVAGALRAAARQLGRSTARRRVTILLSDCRSTVDGDPVAAAGALDELAIVAPASDSSEAEALALQTGARLVVVEGPSAVAVAMTAALERH